jgi:hypothetical protein
MWRIFTAVFAILAAAPAANFQSHPSMRSLPSPSSRPHPAQNLRHVNGTLGSDTNPGTSAKPWRTVGHGVSKLKPGDTLLLHSGVYHEQVVTTARGTANNPITIRSAKGELAIIDGGIPEFFESPATSWEPVGPGEYRSVSFFPDIPMRKEAANLLGNFADSMIPLHGHRFDTDLRSNNHLFQKLAGPKTIRGSGLYCGPGVFLNPDDRRIHIRLAHTRQPSIGERNNYRGETDPRKLRLVIAGAGRSPLKLNDAAHIVLQDLVVRGARDATINLVDCSNITLDGVTSYGGSSTLRVESTSGLRCVNSAFRGIAAPWLWRWSLKYRSLEARIVSASAWNPPAHPNRDFEFAHCEFTDCVDGVFVGNVEGVEIHHCLLDNISDDGFFITCRTAYDGTTGGRSSLHHNRIARVLTAFAFGVGHGRQKTLAVDGTKQLGETVDIHHNVFDLRDPVLYQQPLAGPITTFGRVAGDHGSPAWEPIDFHHNTVLMKDAPWRNYYAAGWAKAMGKGTRRSIRENRFIHETGMPGDLLPDATANFTTAGNIHWSRESGAAGRDSFLKRYRNSAAFQETGWTASDRYEEPGRPAAGFAVGQAGRIDQHGATRRPMSVAAGWEGVNHEFRHPPRNRGAKRAALVLGYPAFDAPILKFALAKAGVEVAVHERSWLPVGQFGNYDLVAFLGNTVRAKMPKTRFTPDEFPAVRRYLEQGGKLLIGRELPRFLFPGQTGRQFLESITGTGPERTKPTYRILQPDHAWIDHLADDGWIARSGAAALTAETKTIIIGDPQAKRSILARIPVGKGMLVYVGWDIARFLPSGRQPSTPELESDYEDQYQIYQKIVADLSR